MTTWEAAGAITRKSNFKNSSGGRNGYGHRLTATALLRAGSNGNGNDKEDGLKHGYNGNRKDEHGVKSGKNIGEKKGNIQFYHELRCGYIRAWNIDSVDKSISALFRHNADIFDICNSYLSGKANEARVYAEFKHAHFVKDANLLLHSDSPFRQIKVFLPLRDITSNNAPFVYHKKSHRFHAWRIFKDLLEFSHYNKKYYDSFSAWSDVELSRFAEKFPELADYESIVTAKAGDVIIADTRGVHGGSILLSDYRLQLGLGYAMLGEFDIGNMPERVKKLVKNT